MRRAYRATPHPPSTASITLADLPLPRFQHVAVRVGGQRDRGVPELVLHVLEPHPLASRNVAVA